MKIKLDENLTTELLPALEELGHDVQTTIEEGLTGKHAAAIWMAAQSEKRFLITQDLDFSDIRKFAPGTHEGVLILRLHPRIKWRLSPALRNCFQTKTRRRGKVASLWPPNTSFGYSTPSRNI